MNLLCSPFVFGGASRPSGGLWLCVTALLIGASGVSGQLRAKTNGAPGMVALDECVRTALVRNRALQIERINPEIARATLSTSYGYYDPVFTADLRKENATDSGGFDPSDFSRDAIYEAESEIANLGVTGFLPTGLSYTLGGNYANSFGARNGLNFDSYKVFAGVTVRQPLLKNAWIDQSRFTIHVNKRNLKISELGVEYVALDVINRVQLAYYEFAFAHEHLQAQEEFLAARERIRAGTTRRLQQGMATLPDEQLALSQVAAAKASVSAARAVLALAENELRIQMGDSFTNQVSTRLTPAHRLVLVPRILDLSDSWQHGLEHRPDLAQLRQEIEKANLNLKFRRNQLFPSLDLVASYGRKGASVSQMAPPLSAQASASEAFGQISDAVAPSDMVGVLFSIPLGGVSDRANYRVGKQLKVQAQLLLKRREELVLREISDALHTAQMALDRVRATSQAVQYSRGAVEAEERRLAAGTSTLFLVLQFQTELASAKLTEIRARADYNKALSQLGFAEASLLARYGFRLDIRE